MKLHDQDSDQEVEVSSASVAAEMQLIGVKLEPVTENIPKFRFSLAALDLPNLIVKAIFYMLCEEDPDV